MTDLLPQKRIQQEKLKKALAHLDYSYKKIASLPTNVEKLDEEMLETWESFAARFGRVCDIFLSRYLRTLVLIEDPGFSGTLRDFLNLAEKMRLINDAKDWLALRELRNIAAHEYSEKDMSIFFEALRNNCPKLLAISNLLGS
ncbi:MAG TPA: HepT-like ribonuclease domain-containing protein [Myxococcota bacterium]|nr:HepT-like ribonuclease domain-containing protein [Myxococcota bacterium]